MKQLNCIILFCIFLSGVTGLMYEIIWTRLLINTIGAASFSISIMVAVFIGGLGLGSFLAGRSVDRLQSSALLLRIYGTLELVIALYALALPSLIRTAGPFLGVWYNRFYDRVLLYQVLVFGICALVCLLPVLCMGAVLPLLSRVYITGFSHIGRRSGGLYGAHTLGAAAGAMLSGFWLLNLLGIKDSLLVAAVINTVVAVLSFLLSARVKNSHEGSPAHERQQGRAQDTGPEPAGPAATGKGFCATLLVMVAISGFCAMAYEVLWTRLMGLIVGPTVYSLTILLSVFIFSMAIGSMVFSRMADNRGLSFSLLVSTQIGAALLALGASQVLGNSSVFFAKIMSRYGDAFLVRSAVTSVCVCCFLFLPVACWGAAFPLAARLYTRSVSRIGGTVGVLTSLGTAGGMLGALLAGLWLVPVLGKERSIGLLAAMQMFAAVAAACRFLPGKGRRAVLLILLSVGLPVCFLYPKWDRALISRSSDYRIGKGISLIGWWDALVNPSDCLPEFEGEDPVYYGDGPGGFVSVWKKTDLVGNVEYILYNSGKADASSRADMFTQTLLAHFPMVFHTAPEKVMVLGLGSGITAGEALHYPVRQLDILEINPRMKDASDFFLPWNNTVLRNPRVRLIFQDARAHLMFSDTKYDVIISEPSNPWMAGQASLFTVEFFQRIRERLARGGVAVQFLHSYQMDWNAFAMVGRTFAQVFPNSILVRTMPDDGGILSGESDYLLAGMKGDGNWDIPDYRTKAADAGKSTNVALSNPQVLFRLVVAEDLWKLFGDGPLNTDDHPLLEFSAPKLRLSAGEQSIEARLFSRRTLSPQTKERVKRLKSNPDAEVDYLIYALSVHKPYTGPVAAAENSSESLQRYNQYVLDYCSKNLVEDFSIFNEEKTKRSCALTQLALLTARMKAMKNKAPSYMALARVFHENGQFPYAIQSWKKAIAHAGSDSALINAAQKRIASTYVEMRLRRQQREGE